MHAEKSGIESDINRAVGLGVGCLVALVLIAAAIIVLCCRCLYKKSKS